MKRDPLILKETYTYEKRLTYKKRDQHERSTRMKRDPLITKETYTRDLRKRKETH